MQQVKLKALPLEMMKRVLEIRWAVVELVSKNQPKVDLLMLFYGCSQGVEVSHFSTEMNGKLNLKT